MRRFLMILGLTLALGTWALGGEIPSVPGPQPPTDDLRLGSQINSGTGDVLSVDHSQNSYSAWSIAVQMMIGVVG